MTDVEEAEAEVLTAARGWSAARFGNDVDDRFVERQSRAKPLADALQKWVAALLTSDERWPLSGRWFDGLVLQRIVTTPREEGDRFELEGFIHRIDTQLVDPCAASFRLSAAGLDGIDVRFGDERALEGMRPEQARSHLGSDRPWRFRFVQDHD